MPRGKKDKKNQEGKKGTDKHKENPQTKPDEKEAAALLSPVHQPPPPSGTPLEPSDDHDEEEDYDDGAGTGCAPGKKKRGLKNLFKKKVKEKKQTSRKSSSGSIKSPVASPQGGSPLPIISKQMVIKELSSSYEVVPKDSEHEMKEFESEPSAKYSLHSSSVSNVPAFVESETTRKLDLHIPEKDPHDHLSSPAASITPTCVVTPGLTPTNSHPLEISQTSVSSNTPTASYKQSLGESTATPEAYHPLEISQTSASNNTPTAGYKPSLGESTATPEAYHPLEISQTSASNNTPTAGCKLSLSENTATPEASGRDKVQEGGAVFYLANDSSTTEDQLEKVRRENVDLDRRLSETEDSIKEVHQESSERVKQVRALSFEARQNEIEKILTDITEQHKMELKQRVIEMERENQETIKKRKEEMDRENEGALQLKLNNATRRVTAVMGKQLKENKEKIETLKAELAERDEQLKELQDKVAQAESTPQHEKEIEELKSTLAESEQQVKMYETLKIELAQKETRMKEEFAKVKEEALSAKETELKEQYAAQLRESEDKIAELDEQVAKLEADKRESEEQRNKELQMKELEKQKLQEQLSQLEEACQKDTQDECEKLKADIEQKDVMIKQLEKELEAKSAKDIGQPQFSGEVSDDAHTKEIEAVRNEMETKLKQQKEEMFQELEQRQMIAEAEKKELIEQHEKTVKELKAQIETEKLKHSVVVAEMETKHKIEVQSAGDAIKAEVQGQQKSVELYGTAQNKELSQQLKEKEDSLDSSKAELAFVRGRLEKSEKEIRQLQEENEQLKLSCDQLNEGFQHHDEHRQLQEAYEQLREEFHQLKVVADMKRQMPPPPGFSSSVDPGEPVLQPMPVQQDIPSNVYHFSHQISKMIDPETEARNAQPQPLSPQEIQGLNQAIGVQQATKPPAYVFAVFAASNSTQSTLLDYTGHFQLPRTEKVSEREEDQDNEEEQHLQFRTALQETNNMTDTQKVEQLEKQLKQTQQEFEKFRQESQKLREELDRLRMSQTQGDRDKDPQQEAIMENLRKNYLKLHTEKMDLLAKLEARDEELKQLRGQKAGANDTHPNVTRSISADGILSPDDPKVEVVQLREVVENKQNKIESLEVQLRSFQTVASERVRLQGHSQDQSRTVMGLRKELEAAQGENQNLFKEIESLKTKLEEQHSALEHEKMHHEDERHAWKQENDAEKENYKKLKQTVASLQATIHQKKPPEEHYQQELADRDLTIGQLRTELNCLRVEIMGQKHSLAEVGKQKMLLEVRLTEANDGIDRLTQDYVTLRETNRRLNEQLSTFERMKTRYDAFKETATSLKGQVEATFTEAQDLKQEKEKLMKQIEDLLGELEARKLVATDVKGALTKEVKATKQKLDEITAEKETLVKKVEELNHEMEVRIQEASQYKEDFDKERKDREEAAGRHVDELARWQCDYQKLEDERQNQQEVFQQTQRVLDEEIIKLSEENRQKEEMITELKKETIKQRNAFESARAESAHHIAELNKHFEITTIAKAELEKCVADLNDQLDQLKDELQVMTVAKQSLDEKIEVLDTKLHVKEKNLELTMQEKAALEERLERVEAQRVGLHHDKVDLQKQLEGAIKDTANLSDELMAKNQQVKQFRKKVEEFRGHLNETRTELDRVKGQLQQTRARMQEQAQFYQEQLKQTGEEAESKAQIEKESCESDKILIENELRQVKRRYTELRDRYDVMFKHHDQLKTILRQHNISPPPLPKVSHGTPTQYQTEQVQLEIQAAPILTHGPESDEPVDPSTLPPAIRHPHVSVYNQQAPQGGQYTQYSQAGGGQVQYPYDTNRDGMQGGHQLAVQGQLGYQTNMDPSQYQTQGGGVVSINERGFRSGNFEELRRNQMQQNVGAMQAQGRMRAGSGSSRDDVNFQHLHQGRGRAIQHDGQRSLTASHIGVASKYADVQSNQPNQAYAGGRAGQFSNQPPANQINPQSSPNYNIPRQQGNVHGAQQGTNYENVQQHTPVSVAAQQFQHHRPQQGGQYNKQHQQYGGGGQVMAGSNQGYGNVSPQQQQQQQMQSQHGQNLGYPASAASEQSQGVAGMQGVAVGMNAGQQLRSGLPAYIQAEQQSHKRPQFPNQQVPSNQPLPPNPSGPQENVLIAGIDQEIQDVAEGVIHRGQGEQSLALDAPIDPNLVCQMCRRRFKIGEIQKYRRHVASCTGSSS